jgi:uncharacterized protein YdaU (DUF1376 family)
MAQFPCLPLWTDAWIADTAHLSVEERGLYHDLLVLMWRTPGCRIPNDHVWITRHLRLRSSEADHLHLIIREFCHTDGNWITQKRLGREYVLAFERKGRLSVLHKHRKGNKKGINGSRSSASDHHEPNINPEPKPKHLDSSLSMAIEEAQARSLASAPDGALAPSPSLHSSPELQLAQKRHLGISPDKGMDYRSPPHTKSDNVLAPLPDKQPTLEEIVRAKGWVEPKAKAEE